MIANGADPRRAWARSITWLLAVAAMGHGAVRADEGASLRGVEQALRDALSPLVAAHEGTVAAAVRHLGTGASYVHDADRPMPLASLVKVPVMVAAYAAAREGRVSLDDRLTFSADDVVPGSAVIDKLSPGATFTLRDAVRMMIASSDNTATNLVIRRIGLPATNEVLDRIGLPGIRLNSLVYRRESSVDVARSREFGLGNGTAAELVRLMAMIHARDLERDGVVAEGACEAMLGHMLACEDRGTAGRDLPPGVKVAHKTGLVSGVRTDAGVILGPAGPIAFCVLTKENRDRKAPGGPADDLIARFARAAVDACGLTGSEDRTEGPRPLAAGASGRLVEDLQRSLNARLPDDQRLGVDGEFGPATAAGVRAFQKRSSLPETGIVDAATRKTIEAPSRPTTPPPLTASLPTISAVSRTITEPPSARIPPPSPVAMFPEIRDAPRTMSVPALWMPPATPVLPKTRTERSSRRLPVPVTMPPAPIVLAPSSTVRSARTSRRPWRRVSVVPSPSPLMRAFRPSMSRPRIVTARSIVTSPRQTPVTTSTSQRRAASRAAARDRCPVPRSRLRIRQGGSGVVPASAPGAAAAVSATIARMAAAHRRSCLERTRISPPPSRASAAARPGDGSRWSIGHRTPGRRCAPWGRCVRRPHCTRRPRRARPSCRRHRPRVPSRGWTSGTPSRRAAGTSSSPAAWATSAAGPRSGSRATATR